jgi:class 3 adenylate cyclase/tetratricopeptide (TPR) repeat protein
VLAICRTIAGLMSCVSCSRVLPDGARFCPFCGHEVVGALTEERRVVTVVFADIVGYTSLSEHLDPERTKRLIDGAFQRLQGDIHEFGGRVDKILGDGVLAIFGAPVGHEDDPDRAIRAAMQMHSSIAAFSESQPDLAAPLQLRIGVNTGEALVGSIAGTDGYTAMGDVVNLASRLQSLAPAGATYIGDATAQLAGDEILREPIEDVAVRGRSQIERVWNVVGHRRRAPMSGGADARPFVGRVAQRQLLASVMSMVADGRSAIVSVSGEAGAGKSLLVDRMLREFPDPRVTIFAGVCVPYGEDNVWAPVAAALFGRLDLDTTVPSDELRRHLREASAARFGFSSDDPSLGRLVEALLHLLGRPSDIDNVSPAEARETMFRLIVESVRLRSHSGPVVVWLDDLQWADPLLIDLLHRLARSLVDRPVLLLTAQRDDLDVDWPPSTDNPITVRMPLDPLDRSEAAELLAALLGEEPEPRRSRQLFERSGGNPLFLTELALLDRSSPDSSGLPGSLRALIGARLDRLDPRLRDVVDNAAVLGTAGGVSSLEQFALHLAQPFDRSDVLALVDEGLLDLDESWWRFRSDVVREVSYQRLTKAVRAQRHAGVAAALGAMPAVPITIAAHHTATAAELVDEMGPVAGVPPDMKSRAVELLTEATRRALDVGALNQAFTHAGRALALGPDDPTAARELTLLRVQAAVTRREIAGAQGEAEQVLEAALAVGDDRHEGRARRYLGQIHQMSGDLDAARDQLGASVEVFRQLGDDVELAASLRERGFVEVFGGSLDDAEWLLGEAEGLSVQLADPRGLAWVRQHQAWAAFLSGDGQLAEQRLALASRGFEEIGDRSGAVWATGLLAFLRFFGFRFGEAEQLAVSVRSEANELGERWGPAMMDTLLASIRLWSGDFGEAEALARRAAHEFRAIDDRFGLVQALGPRNRALVALGRDQEAEQGIEEILALGDRFGDLSFPMMAAAGTAVHLGLGSRAVVVSETALERIAAMGADASETTVTYALGLCQTGAAEHALAALDGIVVDFPYAHATRAVAAAMCGDDRLAIADADAVWSQAGATYLDRVLADIAAAAAEVRAGRSPAATTRLERARTTADEAGDVVATALAQSARSTLLPGAGPGSTEIDSQALRAGWRQVIAGLAGRDPSPSAQAVAQRVAISHRSNASS